MDIKIALLEKDIQYWKDTTWQLYASQMYEKELLRLWISCRGVYKVSYGKNNLYEGSQLTHAVAAWEAA